MFTRRPPKPLPPLCRHHYNISGRKQLLLPPSSSSSSSSSSSCPPPLLLLLRREVDGRHFLALLFTLQTRPKLLTFPAVFQKRVIKTQSAPCVAAATSAGPTPELKETGSIFSNPATIHLSGSETHQHPRRGTMTAPPPGRSVTEGNAGADESAPEAPVIMEG